MDQVSRMGNARHVFGLDRSVPHLSTAALLDQLSQTRPHFPHKLGTAFFPQQRPIEPVVLGDLLEELYPHIWEMLLPEISDLLKQRVHGIFKDLLNQIIFVLIVAIERCPAYHRPLG